MLKNLSANKPAAAASKSVCYRQLARHRASHGLNQNGEETDSAESNQNVQIEEATDDAATASDSHIKIPRLDFDRGEEENTGDRLDKEVTTGELTKYRVVVKTSDRLGSSSEAEIYMQLLGSKGKSRQLVLSESTAHRLPFRRSNIDTFEVEAHDVGVVRAVRIGHNEKDIGSCFPFLCFLDSILTLFSKKIRGNRSVRG
jgi:hypothetical protein